MRTRRPFPAAVATLSMIGVVPFAVNVEAKSTAQHNALSPADVAPSGNIVVYENPVVVPYGQTTATFYYSVEVSPPEADEFGKHWIYHVNGAESWSFSLDGYGGDWDPATGTLLDQFHLSLGESYTIELFHVPTGVTLDSVFVWAVRDDPQLDCATVVCAWGLEETVFPEWVQVTLQVEDVRAVTAAVTRAVDRREIGRFPMSVADGVAEVRFTGLAPSTSYTTEYLVTDQAGNVTVEMTGGFVTGR